MSFLLNTNICSFHLRRPYGLAHRLIQYSGRLFVPTIALGELFTWAYQRPDGAKIIANIEKFLTDLEVLPFDRACAQQFGRLRADLKPKGVTVNPVDLTIASVAMVHDLTLVANNTRDFQRIPGWSRSCTKAKMVKD